MARPRANQAPSLRSQVIEAKRTLVEDAWFACSHSLVGTQIPGRGGGLVSGCATPSKKHPKELQLYIGLPGLGHPIRRTTVRDRLRRPTVKQSKHDREQHRAYVETAVEDYRQHGVPQPVGRLFPARPGSSKCDAENRAWSEYPEVLGDAEERAAIEVPEDASPSEYRRAVGRAVKAARKGPEWREITEACVVAFDRSRGLLGSTSDQRELAQRKRSFVESGGDITSADWRDTLSSVENFTRAGFKRSNPVKRAGMAIEAAARKESTWRAKVAKSARARASREKKAA